jgi:hypothetical protein
MGNKQTAVEWLEDSLRMNFNKIFVDTDFGLISHLIEQAKQIEKEQIINARINGDENHTFNSMVREDYANDYYNETYGK